MTNKYVQPQITVDLLAKGATFGVKGVNPENDDITLRFGLSKPRMEAGLKGEPVVKQHNKSFFKSIGHWLNITLSAIRS